MYPPEIRDSILARIAEGNSLRAVCRQEGMPAMSAVMRWLNEDTAFQEQYARALVMRADAKFDELDDVSSDAVLADTAVAVAGLRLKADNIKWMLGKMAPKKYGERADVNLTGEIGIRRIERVIRDA